MNWFVNAPRAGPVLTIFCTFYLTNMGRKKRPSKSKESEINKFTEVILKDGFTTETVEICIENGFCDKDSFHLLNSEEQVYKCAPN